MAEITDPDLLKQLGASAASSGLVTDPELLKQLNAGPSVAADVAKSVGSGLLGAPIAAAGTPGDLSNLLAKGSKVASDYIAGKMGFEKSPELAAPILPTTEGISHFVGDNPRTLGGLITGENGGRNIVGQALDYDPKTSLGKYGKTAAGFVGNPLSYLGPGGVLAKGATAAASGLGSEAATQITENSTKPWVKAAAPLLQQSGVKGSFQLLDKSPAPWRFVGLRTWHHLFHLVQKEQMKEFLINLLGPRSLVPISMQPVQHRKPCRMVPIG